MLWWEGWVGGNGSCQSAWFPGKSASPDKHNLVSCLSFTWVVSINMYKKQRFLIPEGFLFCRQRFNEIYCLEDKTSLIKLGGKKEVSPLEAFLWALSEMCWCVHTPLCSLRRNEWKCCGLSSAGGSRWLWLAVTLPSSKITRCCSSEVECVSGMVWSLSPINSCSVGGFTFCGAGRMETGAVAPRCQLCQQLQPWAPVLHWAFLGP